jgi:3-hydroxyacyl-[acyl-carrier-protein] dehydratase
MIPISGGYFHFDPQDPIYADHFPGHPVVPGSLIVWAFSRALEQSGYDFKEIRLDHFRFRRFVEPGSYRFTLTPTDAGMRCTLFDKDKAVAEGTIRP